MRHSHHHRSAATTSPPSAPPSLPTASVNPYGVAQVPRPKVGSLPASFSSATSNNARMLREPKLPSSRSRPAARFRPVCRNQSGPGFPAPAGTWMTHGSGRLRAGTSSSVAMPTVRRASFSTPNRLSHSSRQLGNIPSETFAARINGHGYDRLIWMASPVLFVTNVPRRNRRRRPAKS